MNIGVTGNTGFVGGNLTSYLKSKNYNIIGVSRTPFKSNELKYSDLNLTVWNSINTFIHLAGKAHDLKKTSKENDYYKINTELTKTLFDQFLVSDCKVFIYTSSVKAVADHVDGILTEGIIPNPKTVYGKSKLAAELYILSKIIPENKKVYILRPCMIHGPNNQGNLNLLYSFVSTGIPYPFGRYVNRRSFVSIENLCFIIKELIDNNKIESGIYNIADDEHLSTIDLISIISEVLNKPTKILKLPKLFVRFIARVGDFFPIPINSERLLKLTENYVVSNLKIKNAIQKTLPLSSEEGIKKTITSFQK
ncbi:NAD-dependent epimerase/dehydratase family protein [Polaribacter marinivivus]|uniref:NAD-dependent epimerase/dehydratase family protein n=1 Tax=Polaribacter marinivivus TaxID=1524260 RepID=UPI003D33A10F